MGWLGRLFGTDKAIDNVIDSEKGLLAKAGGWIDRQQFTDEEKAEMKQKLMPLQVDLLNALSQFKVVQRFIVFMVMGIWAFLALNLVAAIWFSNEAVINLLIQFMQSNYITIPSSGVVLTYLGGGTFESWGRAKMGGKS